MANLLPSRDNVDARGHKEIPILERIDQDSEGERVVLERAPEAGRPDAAEHVTTDKQHLQALRQGPLSGASVPSGPVSATDIEEIKRALFPKIDFEKENPTPQQLVTYLLVHHSMDLDQAHNWVEFLAHNQPASSLE